MDPHSGHRDIERSRFLLELEHFNAKPAAYDGNCPSQAITLFSAGSPAIMISICADQRSSAGAKSPASPRTISAISSTALGWASDLAASDMLRRRAKPVGPRARNQQ